MNKILVSIIIPIYNGSNYMREAIDSALAQTYENIEILIVNDGSTDDTEKIALEYVQKHGDRIRYFPKGNGGVSTALNLALREMKGEYFQWLSHDDIIFPNKIKSQIALIEKRGEAGIVFSGWAVIDENGREKNRIRPSKRFLLKDLETPLYALFHFMINGISLLVPRAVLDSFRTDLRITQDVDMWFRAMKRVSIYYSEGIFSATRMHSSQVTRKSNSAFNSEGDNFWLTAATSLTSLEKAEMNGSEYKFYRDFYVNNRLFSQHKKTMEYCLNEAKKIKPLAGLDLIFACLPVFIGRAISKIGRSIK